MVFFPQKKEQKKKYWCKVLLIKQIRRMINQGSHAYTISIYYRTCNRNESTHIRICTHTHIHIQLKTNQHTLLFTCDNRHLVIQNYHDTTPLSQFDLILVLAISFCLQSCCCRLRCCCRQMERDFPSSSCSFFVSSTFFLFTFPPIIFPLLWICTLIFT